MGFAFVRGLIACGGWFWFLVLLSWLVSLLGGWGGCLWLFVYFGFCLVGGLIVLAALFGLDCTSVNAVLCYVLNVGWIDC